MLFIFLGCPSCQETPHFTRGSCCGVNSSSFYRPRRDGRLSRPRKLLHAGFEPGSLAPQAATLPLRHTVLCIYIHIYIYIIHFYVQRPVQCPMALSGSKETLYMSIYTIQHIQVYIYITKIVSRDTITLIYIL